MNHFFNKIVWQCDNWRSSSRANRRRKGLLRYPFRDHILILGGGGMVEELLEAIATRQEWAEKSVVVLSSLDAEQVRGRLALKLSLEAKGLAVNVYHGERTMAEELRMCHVDQASLIFIVGEDGENGHDALNVECWKKVRALRLHAPQVAQCYLSLDSSSTISLLHMLPQEAHTSVETTIINRSELMVQQLLMGDSPQAVPQTLDRGLITVNADRYVHLVVVGMNAMGYAFATTAAQMCHFPNFDESSPKPLRTRITFVDPAADVKMNHFKSSHASLFDLSHSRYMTDPSSWLQGRPESRYGDFLDVEWEFVKAAIDAEWVRGMLVLCATDAQQVLSVAFCSDSADENFQQSIHLPQQLYADYSDIGEARNDEPNIYVYQPQSNALVRAAQAEVARLRNLIPFGAAREGYDPLLTRQTSVAKRVNYLYQKETSGKQFVAMPTDTASLDGIWQQLSLAEKLSSIRSASAVYAQLRGLGLDAAQSVQPLDDGARVDSLSRTEQARRNMEKLLVGYAAMPAAERHRLNAALANDDPEVRQEARTYANRNANQLFVLKDIAPYSGLPEAAKADIRTIVSNLPLAALPHISSVEEQPSRS